MTPKSEGYNQLVYNGKAYNLKLVSGLYQFLIDASAASDVGTNLTSLQLGSLVIWGRPDGSIDFEHIAMVTNTTDPTNPLLTQHNWADVDYPSTLLNSFKDEHGSSIVVTHILQVNYALIAGGQLSSALGQDEDLRLDSPAPYHTHIIIGGLYVSWDRVKGATAFTVTVTDMNGNVETQVNVGLEANAQKTFFKIDLSQMKYGNYNSFIQPLSNSSTFGVFYDTFNYQPVSCLGVPQDSGLMPAGTHACFTASGTY